MFMLSKNLPFVKSCYDQKRENWPGVLTLEVLMLRFLMFEVVVNLS